MITQNFWSNRYIMIAAVCTVFLAGIILVGCADKSTEDEFKVAMLLPGEVTDAGWNQLAYEGLLAIEKELGAKINHVVSKTPTDQEEHFRFYAGKGYDLIIGHGYEFQEPAKQVAPDFPETIFINSSGGFTGENIAPINFRVEQPAYLMGIIAGMMTKSNKLGVLGGDRIPSIQSTFLAFEAGAKSVNPDVEVEDAYTGNWDDAGEGKRKSKALIDQGVDFLFPNADAAGLGAYHAAADALKDGKTVYTFGVNKDKSEISPDTVNTVLANGVITPDAFVQIARIVKDGKFEKQIYTYNMLTENAITFNYNPKMKDKIPDEVLKKVEEVKAKILAAEFEVPQDDFTNE